jgi:hypothetical protein
MEGLYKGTALSVELARSALEFAPVRCAPGNEDSGTSICEVSPLEKKFGIVVARTSMVRPICMVRDGTLGKEHKLLTGAEGPLLVGECTSK